MDRVVSFPEALAATEHQKRHLLLGNGFSISLFPDRFLYRSLLEVADFSDIPAARQAFDSLGTTDFEAVIHALRQASALLPLYRDDAETSRRMEDHAERLKEGLVQAIAGRHPERPSEVSDAQHRSCRNFLGHFAGDRRKQTGKDCRGSIFTLNYDMLLYWASLHDEILELDEAGTFTPTRLEPIQHDDGFRSPDGEPEADYVTWDGEEAYSQCIYYLHGALHLYDYGHRLQKICWKRSGGTPLVDQIRKALDERRFPRFVSEGRSEAKFERIRHSGYLHTGLRKFRGACNSRGALFVYGHSLADNDAHIFKQISRGKIQTLYVSLYGDAESEGNRAIREKATLIAACREEDLPRLEVYFYDAGSANVWNG